VGGVYDEARVAAQRLGDRLADLEARLGAPDAAARDLASLHQERDKVAGLLGEADDRELAALFALEPLDRAIADVRAQAQPLAARRVELQGVVRALTASRDEEVAALGAERAALVAAVPADLRERYERARARVGTSGAAEVVDGHCDGCRIALSPADLDRWRASTRATLIDCPECGRVLLP
jgi:predicted  nucleic acid-binding Zn-ribbon protein